MNIPDYFPNDDNECQYPICFPFSMVLIGMSGCGKTNTLVHLLLNPFFEYDKIYYYGLNPFQSKIMGLKEIFDNISKKVGYNIFEIQTDPNKIINPNDYNNPNSKKVIIFDDLIKEKSNIQSIIEKYFSNSRHNNCSPIYLGQHYSSIPLFIRQNSKYFILYPQVTNRYNKIIENDHGLAENTLKNILQNGNGHDFLYIDKFKKKIYKNFNQEI